jgi:glycosyltransferase involved in cell wall biosynthesis
MSLVSIIIASYNSSSFIIETLLSVYNQTWEDLELIITDDCSSDDTVDVCSRWLSENSNRFARTELLISEKNTGVSSNANRGLKTAKGIWVKFLGADDTLMPNCIKDNMLWIESHPEVKVLFSRINIYENNFNPQSILETTEDDTYNQKSIMAVGRKAESQYKMLLISDRIHYTPSVFIHRETMNTVGGFDERFEMQEDYPLWLNLTRQGYKLNFMNKVTVNYRQHSKAINNNGISFLINPNYLKSENLRKVYTYPYLPFDIWLDQHYNLFVAMICRWILLNRNNKPNRFIFVILSVYLNPFRYLIWLRKKFDKSLMNNEFYM